MMIYTALIMGLLGSLHCIGMCGPLALALPVKTNVRWIKMTKYLLFNAGRLTTYALIGLLSGILGKVFSFANFQQIISVLFGIILISTVILINNPLSRAFNKPMTIFKERLSSVYRAYFHEQKWYSLFILGLLNGLLPCGMVYTALAGAVVAGSPIEGAMFMTTFGIGTLPALMAVALSKGFIWNKRSFFLKVTPVLTCTLGIILILRGLSLDIPFVSPLINEKGVHRCH